MADRLYYYKHFDELIRSKRTGRPADLARRFEISVSFVKNIIRYMREDYGAPIRFEPRCNSYIYTRPGHFRVGFFDSPKEELMEQISVVLDKFIS